jgi:hypothetical protein
MSAVATAVAEADRPPALTLARLRPAGHVLLALALGLLLTGVQVCLALVMADRSTVLEAYASLMEYDSWWYGSIAADGYAVASAGAQVAPDTAEAVVELQGNVAFMPGYPLLTRLAAGVTGLPAEAALLPAAQLACWASWTYLLLFFRRWRVPCGLALAGILLVLFHPGSFFLVAAYSESLFLAALLGFLYWLDRPSQAAWPVAAAHGLVMGATRLFGLPLALYPLARWWLSGRGRAWAAALVPAAAVGLGAGLFFAYCHFHLGRWDLHLETLRRGWGVKPMYHALLTPEFWHVNFPRTRDGFLDPDALSRLLAVTTLLTMAGMLVLEWRLARRHGDPGWRQRLGLYGCAALMYYVNVSGRLAVKMTGMVRYDVCVYVLLVLGLVHLLTRVGPPEGRRLRWALVLLAAWWLIGLVLQLGFTYRFTHDRWVA